VIEFLRTGDEIPLYIMPIGKKCSESEKVGKGETKLLVVCKR